MKLQNTSRKLGFSAVDLLTENAENCVGGVRFAEVEISQIVPFHNHVFRLYTGQRQADMVASIKEHGVMTPVILHQTGRNRYEMLSGHNRMTCSKMAGLSTVPAIIKESLTEEQAIAYVIETNLMQRSFTDLLPTEKAAVLKMRLDTLSCQGRRNDILRELEILEKRITSVQTERKSPQTQTSVQTERKSKRSVESRELVGKEYGLSPVSVSRYIRLCYLIDEYKQMVDDGAVSRVVGENLSMLSHEAQRWVYDEAAELRFKLTEKYAEMFLAEQELTRERVHSLIVGVQTAKAPKQPRRKVSVPRAVYDSYLKGYSDEEIPLILEKALQAYFPTKTG